MHVKLWPGERVGVQLGDIEHIINPSEAMELGVMLIEASVRAEYPLPDDPTDCYIKFKSPTIMR